MTGGMWRSRPDWILAPYSRATGDFGMTVTYIIAHEGGCSCMYPLSRGMHAGSAHGTLSWKGTGKLSSRRHLRLSRMPTYG
jgi:hypothetical protein